MPGSPESNQPNHEWRAPKPQPESAANPFALLSREQRGEGEPSHEELVANIREELGAYMKRKQLDRYSPYPVVAMRDWLLGGLSDLDPARYQHRPNYTRDQIPHYQLVIAWELISHPYYPDRYWITRDNIKGGLERHAREFGHTITLDPNEGELLSAMAEAVGIPNPFDHMPQEKKPSK